jgi:hypothetical protein
MKRLGVLDMRYSAGVQSHQSNHILVSGDGVSTSKMSSSGFGVERGLSPSLHNLFDVFGTNQRLAQIKIAIERNLENPKMFYIISTSLRDGSMQDREDSVEFIDSK